MNIFEKNKRSENCVSVYLRIVFWEGQKCCTVEEALLGKILLLSEERLSDLTKIPYTFQMSETHFNMLCSWEIRMQSKIVSVFNAMWSLILYDMALSCDRKR